MATTETVITTATRLLEASSLASGTSSEKTIQIMAPAAKPNPQGSSGRKTSTKKYAGTAIRGWGRLEKMLQNAARTQPTPRGTSTRLMASPSGILWTARARLMNRPRAWPPPKDTPIATPSVNECSVMTPTMSSALRASRPLMLAKTPGCSSCRRDRRATTMNARPGTAPSPVATAVSSAKRKTQVAPTGSIPSTLLGAALARELPPSDLGLWIDQQRPGRRIFALGCGIDLPLQPALSEPRVPNGVLHLGDAPQATPREICGEDYHRPGVQLHERLTDRPVQPSLYRVRDASRPYHLSPLPAILSSLGDGPDVPQGAARPQKLLVRPLREHQPLVNEETRAGEQIQELATRVVWAVPRLSETPDELALRHSKSLPTALSALLFPSLRDDRSREESSRHCEQLPYRSGHKRPRHEQGCPCAWQGLIKWDVDRRERERL